MNLKLVGQLHLATPLRKLTGQHGRTDGRTDEELLAAAYQETAVDARARIEDSTGVG